MLSDVSLAFPTGRITSLIGPNGAGKSTLLMMMARLLEPSSGYVSLDGQKISEIRTSEYAHHVATAGSLLGFNLRLTVEE